jgi:hypothetical protein
MDTLSLPLVAIASGVLLLLLAAATLVRQRRTVEIVSDHQITVPSFWDERAITNQVHLYSKEPAILSHYVLAIKERFIIGQNDRTIQKRTLFLKSVFEQANIIKNLKAVGYEMAKMDAQHEVEMLELELRRLDLTAQHSQHGTISSLKQEDEELEVRLRIAQKQRQIAEIKSPPQSEVKLSPEQQRTKDKQACETRIAELKQAKQDALKLQDEAERILRVNALDDAIQREYERWSKLV